ncbi:MAG TPA: glycosyltransferase family 39 protein [Phycisphaerales bacterium]|nr:glycosyltransferase family 39 protein [Phycisphaerales bacterium]
MSTVNGASATVGSGGYGGAEAGGVWRTRARSWGWAGVSLVVLCLAVYLPGLWTIPPVDRDECRFAQASRQMFEAAALPASQRDVRTDEKTGLPTGMHAGGWVVPMYATKPRLNKPPLVYWLQVASAWALTGGDPSRDAMWMYRLPSLLCAVGTVLMTWRLGIAGRLFDPRAAWLGAAILAVSPMVVWDAHQARADQLLTLCTVGAMACLWRVVKRDAAGDRSTLAWAAGMWLWLGLGVLAKGFITPLVVLGAIAAVCAAERSLRVLRASRPLLGIVVVAAMVAPWVWMLGEQVGLGNYWRELWKEVFLRAATGAKDGGRVFLPPGVHILLLGVLFWPGCLLVWPAVGRAIERAWGVSRAEGNWWRRVRFRAAALRGAARGRRAELFLLAWIVPAWVVFELSPAKLPHYTMPLLPALALLASRELFAAQARLRTGGRVGVWGWFAVGAVMPLAAGGAVWISENPPELKAHALVFIVGLVCLPVWGVLLVSVQFIRGQRWVMASVGGVIAGGFMLAMTLHAVVPVLVRMQKPKLLTGNLTQRLFDRVRELDPRGERPIASVYLEDSVVFHSRGRVQKIRAADQAKWLQMNAAGILIGTSEADALHRDAWVFGNYAVLAPVRWSDGKYSDPPPRNTEDQP